VEVCIKRLRMKPQQLAAALNGIDTDKLKVGLGRCVTPPSAAALAIAVLCTLLGALPDA
jgi:hypothetical protein